eukprot:15436801-Alexandrium_andersonii.AAC.1
MLERYWQPLRPSCVLARTAWTGPMLPFITAFHDYETARNSLGRYGRRRAANALLLQAWARAHRTRRDFLLVRFTYTAVALTIRLWNNWP